MGTSIWKYLAMLTLLTVFLIAVDSCPSSDLPKPCECIEEYGKLFIKCDGAKKSVELEKSLKMMAGFKVTRLDITNCKMKHIHSAPLANINISKIQVSKSSLFYLFDRPLSGFVKSSLVELKLDQIFLDGGLDWETLDNLEELEQLSIVNTSLEQIPRSFTSITLPKLKTLELVADEIQYLDTIVFKSHKGIRNFILKQNLLTHIERSMFATPIAELQFLDLSHNRLTVLPKDIFDGMPKLQSLLLDNNQFITLDTNYMTKVWKQLFFFSVKDNPLQCNCELSWILQEKKPYHLFGHCTQEGNENSKELKELTEADFTTCI